MNLAISLTLAIVPALIIVIYLCRKDRAKPEPKGSIIRIFLLGLLSTLPAIFIELGVDELRVLLNPYYRILYPVFKAFIVAGLVEESLKLFIVKKYAFRKKCFDEVMDGIVYTVVAGMGFACMENVLYVLGSGITVGILRAFTSIPMHASVSVIMGYWIGMAKFSKNRGSRSKLILKGFLLAVLFHGLYDLCIFAIPFWSEFVLIGLLPVLAWAIILAKRKIKTALQEDEKAGRIPRIF
ncbi:MAG: PrsW family intramembrane metalloprotease [Candidatus Aegiribacteria sp.]|nr:PrsW family intramembrane metalloprotease [Candidatus Aegiribacteria sp.]